MGTLWGEAPWRKPKKKLREKKKQKNIWGLFGGRPHGENKKR
jgi:hypothetical protein